MSSNDICQFKHVHGGGHIRFWHGNTIFDSDSKCDVLLSCSSCRAHKVNICTYRMAAILDFNVSSPFSQHCFHGCRHPSKWKSVPPFFPKFNVLTTCTNGVSYAPYWLCDGGQNKSQLCFLIGHLCLKARWKQNMAVSSVKCCVN